MPPLQNQILQFRLQQNEGGWRNPETYPLGICSSRRSCSTNHMTDHKSPSSPRHPHLEVHIFEFQLFIRTLSHNSGEIIGYQGFTSEPDIKTRRTDKIESKLKKQKVLVQTWRQQAQKTCGNVSEKHSDTDTCSDPHPDGVSGPSESLQISHV